MAAASLAVESVAAPTLAMSPTVLAAMRAKEGEAVVLRDGCHWRSAYPGFFQPVHLLERVRAAAVRRPARLCWGFRAALPQAEADRANASIPLHILADVRGFDEASICRNRAYLRLGS